MSETQYKYGWAKVIEVYHYYDDSKIACCLTQRGEEHLLVAEPPNGALACDTCRRGYDQTVVDAKGGDSPCCPWCGDKIEDWAELGMDYDGANCEVQCDRCERRYEITMELSVTFNTEKVKPK